MKQCFTHCHSSPHPAAVEHENPTLFTQQSALTEGEDGETGQWWIREQMLLGEEEMERQSAGSVKSLTCLQLNTATGWRMEEGGGWTGGAFSGYLPRPNTLCWKCGFILTHVRNNTNYRLHCALKCWFSLGGSVGNSVLIIVENMMAIAWKLQIN